MKRLIPTVLFWAVILLVMWFNVVYDDVPALIASLL